MQSISIQVNYDRALSDLKSMPDIAVKAMISALNKTAKSVKTEAEQAITERYKIAKKDLKGKITVQRATAGTPEARVVAREKRPIPLIRFVVGRTTRKTGVRVEVIRGRRKRIGGAFVAQTSSGHRGVFVRKFPPKPRVAPKYSGLPIRELRGPAIPRLFRSEGIRKRLIQRAQEIFPKRFVEDFNFYRARKK